MKNYYSSITGVIKVPLKIGAVYAISIDGGDAMVSCGVWID